MSTDDAPPSDAGAPFFDSPVMASFVRERGESILSTQSNLTRFFADRPAWEEEEEKEEEEAPTGSLAEESGAS